MNYHGSRVNLDLDRKTPLSGDRAGLFNGVIHEWDGNSEKLSLNLSLDFDLFRFRSYANDLSFADTDDDAVIFSGNVLSFTLSRAWPVEIAFELFSAIRYNSIGESTFYPILFVDAPLLSLEDISFALRFGLLNRMEKWNLEEMLFGEHSFFFSFPLKIKDDEISLGIYFQHDGVYYNLYNDNYVPNLEDESIAIFLDSDLNFDRFNLNINSFINFDRSTLKLLEESSYFDAALSFRIGNLDFLLGARKQNLFTFDDFFLTSDFYFGLGAETGSILTEFVIRYKNGHPEIGFSSSLAFVDIDNNTYIPYRVNDHIDLLFDLGFDYYYKHGLYFHVSPIISFFGEGYEIAFRFPLHMELKDEKINLVSFKADPWFDMWQNNTTINDIYDSITDMFTLIECIRLGDIEESLFFIDASRNRTKNDIFFENYSSFDALSLDIGFNFYNLDFGIYVDDLEAPRIIDPYISVFPINSSSFALTISAPTEIMLEDSRNFKTRSFLGFTYSQPLVDEHLNLSFFLYGESYAEYVDGVPVETRIIYDFDNMELYGYLLGGAVEWEDEFYSVSLNGGIHSGLLYPNYYNAFSSLNPDIDRSSYDIEGMSFYFIGEATLSFEYVDLLFKYSMPNIKALVEDWKSYDGDMLTFDMQFSLINGVGMHLRLSKLNFISSFADLSSFTSYFDNPYTIYSAAITKDFDNLSLEVELSTMAIYEESRYMNSYRLEDVSPRLKVNARIGF